MPRLQRTEPLFVRSVDHRWRPQDYSGGTLSDSGSGTAKNLTGTMSTTTSNGVLYGSFNGTSQSLSAAAAADWTYLHNTSWTMGLVVYTGIMSPCTRTAVTNTGISVNAGPGSASADCLMSNAGSAVWRVMNQVMPAVKAVHVFRCGLSSHTSIGGVQIEWGFGYFNGWRYGFKNSTWTTNSVTPAGPLIIGKTSTQSGFQAGTFLDFFLDNREWMDDEVYAYTRFWHYKLGLI